MKGDAGGEDLEDPLSTFTVPVTSQAPAVDGGIALGSATSNVPALTVVAPV